MAPTAGLWRQAAPRALPVPPAPPPRASPHATPARTPLVTRPNAPPAWRDTTAPTRPPQSSTSARTGPIPRGVQPLARSAPPGTTARARQRTPSLRAPTGPIRWDQRLIVPRVPRVTLAPQPGVSQCARRDTTQLMGRANACRVRRGTAVRTRTW